MAGAFFDEDELLADAAFVLSSEEPERSSLARAFVRKYTFNDIKFRTREGLLQFANRLPDVRRVWLLTERSLPPGLSAFAFDPFFP